MQGLFLRALLRVNASPRVVEWNTIPSSLRGITYWFSKRSSPPSIFNRCEYHDLGDISGISAAVQGSKTIGLFCHRRGSRTTFKSFVARLERTYPSMRLIFLFFPLDKEENIQTVAVRRRPDLRFPTDTPVIQVRSPFSLYWKAITKLSRSLRTGGERVHSDHSLKTRTHLSMNAFVLSLAAPSWGCVISLPVTTFLLCQTLECWHRADVIDDTMSMSLPESFFPALPSAVRTKAGASVKLIFRLTPKFKFVGPVSRTRPVWECS